MRKKLFCLLACLCLCASGCGGKPQKPPDEKPVPPEGFDLLTAAAAPVGTGTGEIGVEFDPHFFISDQSKRDQDPAFAGVDPGEFLAIIEQRVREMGIGRFRVMICPSWLEPFNDNGDPDVIDPANFTFDSVEMKGVREILDMAERCSVKVTAVLWGVNRFRELQAEGYVQSDYFMARGNAAENWVIGAKGDMMYEYVECFSALMQHLLDEENYTCIDEITPGNEPDWSWQIDGSSGDAEAYTAMVRALDLRFRRDGLRDRLRFNLADATDVNAASWLGKIEEGIAGVADKINVHTYAFSSETPNSEIAAWVRGGAAYAERLRVPFYIGEFGSYADGSTGVQKDSFERGLGLARQMLNFYNNGACGMSYWNLFDHYNVFNGATFERMDKEGLWYTYRRMYAGTDYENLIEEDFQVRRQFYMYGLMASSIRPGMRIHPLGVEGEFAIGTRFSGEDGREVLVICNQSDDPLRYAYAADDSAQYQGRVYSADALPTDGSPLAVTLVLRPKSGYLSLLVPPDTLMVIEK